MAVHDSPSLRLSFPNEGHRFDTLCDIPVAPDTIEGLNGPSNRRVRRENLHLYLLPVLKVCKKRGDVPFR